MTGLCHVTWKCYVWHMADTWKTVRLRATVYERVEAMAKAAERSVASYVESLIDAGLVRAAGRVPNALVTLRAALIEADAKGAVQAASILRDVIAREEQAV